MKTNTNKKRYAQALVGVCLGAGIVDVASCSSSNPAQGGKRVEFGQWAGGVDAGDAGDASPIDATGRSDTALREGGSYVSSNIDNMGKQYIVPRPPSEIAEEDWGLTLSPEEKERVNICSRRPWSKNVPDRDCTKDNQCGDGLCDRGRCAAMITCLGYPGGPCKVDKHCKGLCIEGRCFRRGHADVTRVIADDAFGHHRETKTVFDKAGVFPTKHINAMGHETVSEYDNALGVLRKETDPNGLTTESTHDGLGRLTSEQRPDGSQTWGWG